MSKRVVTDSKYYKAIANMLRDKLGTNDTYKPSEMPAAIEAVAVKSGSESNDAFWEAFQFGGSKWDYTRAFSGGSWNATTFNPKYPLHCAGCEEMFCKFNHDASFEAVDLTKFDITTDKATTFQFMFWNANVSHIPAIDLTSATTSLWNIFTWTQTQFDSPLESIASLKMKEGQSLSKECFTGLKNLVTLLWLGTLTTSVWLQDCVKLSKESILSLNKVLGTPTITNATITLSLEAVNNAFETKMGLADGSTSAEWLSVIESNPLWVYSLL